MGLYWKVNESNGMAEVRVYSEKPAEIAIMQGSIPMRPKPVWAGLIHSFPKSPKKGERYLINGFEVEVEMEEGRAGVGILPEWSEPGMEGKPAIFSSDPRRHSSVLWVTESLFSHHEIEEMGFSSKPPGKYRLCYLSEPSSTIHLFGYVFIVPKIGRIRPVTMEEAIKPPTP